MIVLSLGLAQAFLTVLSLRLPCVVGDRGGQAAGPVTSAMRRKRPTTVSGPHVAMGREPTFALQKSKPFRGRLVPSGS
jgi:hypothetical protein